VRVVTAPTSPDPDGPIPTDPSRSADGTRPTGATEPTDPTGLTGPTDPTGATEPIKPTAPTRPDPAASTTPASDDDRLLVLFDADCGFCLHGRDLLRRWDRGRRLTDDMIQRRADDLLADLGEERRLATWHAIHPDGRRESGGAALAAVLERLPGAAPAAWVARRLPGPTDRAYRWMAGHRAGISGLLRTREHPDKHRVTDR